ncbi:Reticulon-4-interacting protein 1-like protein [Colletotrichum aenigma]|uniref:Reticulon-4-interacting protein 1-like protein n=1 Tax=Colletotrichum aenigma TaxID=1215731 RepID=UPI0018725CDB|nr:Reticulon-4-interacting protein 1-like protein [Colletotrichum aenigma]KAF5520582.1 Reticulon-4-interacting protein 1-like protein [Colletotrichum aenigma]
MSTHKALVIHTLQQPPSIIERPTPVPKEDEILLKVSIVGYNLPSPLGVDIVGEVVSCGRDVTQYQVGDRVFAFGSPFSADSTGTQEYCVVPAWQSAPLPKGISADEAATFPLNAMTMVFALLHKTGLNLRSPFGADKDECNYSAESILIIGGGTATGNFGVQLARLAKFGNIIVVASKARESQLKVLGATTVIDRGLDESQIENQIGDVDESRIGSKFAGYVRNQVLCNTMKYPHTTKEFWGVLPNLIENGTLRPTTFQVVDGLDIETVDTFLVNYSRGLGQTKPHFHLGNTFAYW